MRRAAATIATILMASAVSFASARAQPANVPEIEEIPAGINALLNDYGKGFQSKNRDLFARTLDGPLRDVELRAFDNAREVSFRQFVVKTTTQFSGNLAYKRVRALYPGKDVATYHITEETALDIETTPYEEDGAYTFVRSGPSPGDPYDGWRIVSKSDLDILAFFAPYHLWDAGPVSVLRSEHFVLLTHPEVVEEMRPVIAVAEKAYEKSSAFWPKPVGERYVILVPATTEELGDLMHAAIDLGKFVAFVSAGADQEEGWVPTGPRMFVHLQHLRNYDPDGQLEILAHELLHAFTRPVSGPHIPVWVEEGLANSGGGNGGRPLQARNAPVPDEFPSDERFLTGPVNQIITLYDQSQVAIEVLIEQFGRDALARFYERLGSARVVAGTDRYHVRRSISDALDWTEDEWVAAWHKRLG